MGKFSHLKTEVTKDTVRSYTMYGIQLGETEDGEPINPVLTVRPAWDINTDYANARIKVSAARSKQMQKKGVSAGDIRRIRREDIPLYAEHIVVGWNEDTVIDENGNPVKFTQEDLLDFLKSIPEQEFDDLRSWCNDYANWGQDPLDDEEVVGNSSSG